MLDIFLFLLYAKGSLVYHTNQFNCLSYVIFHPNRFFSFSPKCNILQCDAFLRIFNKWKSVVFFLAHSQLEYMENLWEKLKQVVGKQKVSKTKVNDMKWFYSYMHIWISCVIGYYYIYFYNLYLYTYIKTKSAVFDVLAIGIKKNQST